MKLPTTCTNTACTNHTPVLGFHSDNLCWSCWVERQETKMADLHFGPPKDKPQ